MSLAPAFLPHRLIMKPMTPRQAFAGTFLSERTPLLRGVSVRPSQRRTTSVNGIVCSGNTFRIR
jgi:hypothetical protein